MSIEQKCFKREVCAVIVDNTGKIAIGENLVYNQALTECPRAKGEGYDKCISVCNQKGHAEIMAIKEAKSRGLELKGASLYLMGHHRICDPCKEACDRYGINVKIVDKEGL